MYELIYECTVVRANERLQELAKGFIIEEATYIPVTTEARVMHSIMVRYRENGTLPAPKTIVKVSGLSDDFLVR